MLSDQVIQRTIRDIGDISGYEASLWTKDAECLAASGQSVCGLEQAVRTFAERSEAEGMTEYDGEELALFAVRTEGSTGYILLLQGSGEDRGLAGRMGSSQLAGLVQTYEAPMDQNSFIQKLLLDKLLLVDIYNLAGKLRVANERDRIVFVVESGEGNDGMVMEAMRGLYGMDPRNFVTAVDERHVILVKELNDGEGYTEILQTAKMMADTLSMEAMVNVIVSYGTVVRELKDISRSYNEAGTALEIGRVFYNERQVLAYNDLGIGRLVHQLPRTLCQVFLEEVLKGNAAELFDKEELTTVYAFFENNLNISETARQLFVHRNTLVYRLEKIQRKTGLDVRTFEDALTFKIAVMVEQHLKYMEEQ